MRKALTLIGLLLLSGPALGAEELPKLKTSVKTLAAFKNGLGFVFRTGQTNLDKGWASMDEIPPAALGTLWIGTTTTGARVQEVRSFKSKTEEDVDPTNISELLEVNAGRKVRLSCLTHGEPALESFEAELISVPKGAALLMVKFADGSIRAINRADVVGVTLDAQAPIKKKVEKTANAARLRVESIGKKEAPASAEISLAYLEKGITWSPSYLVNIHDPKQADITLEAVLANDVEDLEDVEVSLVVGYPNFIFADLVTPLALQQSVGDFVGRLVGGPADGRERFRNITAQSSGGYGWPQGIGDARPSAWSPEAAYSATQPMAGESNEDLYFYRQPNVTLKKGDRVRYTVFTGKAPYEHIYEWLIPDDSRIDWRGYRQDDRSVEQTPNQVWHSLRLENKTEQPWTTAPAFAVNGPMPVAQGALRYTPPDAKNTLKLTVATDVRADQAQTEVSREMVKIGYNEYDQITVDGKLIIKNLKPASVRMNVKKQLTGEVLTTGQDGKSRKVAESLAAVNPNSEIEWEFDLASGAEKELAYRYKVLIRR